MRWIGVYWMLCAAVALVPENAAAGPQFGQPTPQDEPKVDPAAAIVRQLLDAGLVSGLKNYRRAEQIWRKNRLASADDGRLDFAWGLVLRKHSKNRQAERQFDLAAGRTKNRYRPAAQAAAWTRLARGQTVSGLALVDELIPQIAERAQTPTNGDLVIAHWIGRVVAALENLSLSKRDQACLQKTRKIAAQQLTGKLKDAFDAGHEQVAEGTRALQAEQSQIEFTDKKKQAQSATQRTAEFNSKKKTIGKQQELLQLTAEEWKTQIDKQTEATKTQLKRLTEEYRAVERQRNGVSQSIQLAQRERNVLLIQMRSIQANSRGGTTVGGQQNDQRRRAVEQRIFADNNRYLAMTRQMNGLQQVAAQTLRNHQIATKQYENATGQIFRQNADLSKLESQIKRQESKLRKAQGKKAVGVNLGSSRLKRFSTYVAFDIDIERQRLLESLGVKKQP